MASVGGVFWVEKYRICWFCMLTMFVVTAFDVGMTQERQQSIKNVSRVIDDLLETYDIRLRPRFGGDPVDIGMEIAIASFDSISEVNMDYTITIYLNQYWKDERLSFSDNNEDNMTLTGDFTEKIWVPDTFFANDKLSFLHSVTERNHMIRLYGDGSIVYGMRFTTTLACMMDLHFYPMDVQNCTVEIESYGYPMEDVVMQWKGESLIEAVHGVELIEIPQFTLVRYRTISTVESLATGRYQRLSLSFKLERNIGFFLFQNYLPSILIVMLSWVSFWINHEASSARVALGITTVLTMTTINTGVRSALPRISYVKAIDIYLVMCFFFVFAALLEYAAVNYSYWDTKAKRKAKQRQPPSTTTSMELQTIGRHLVNVDYTRRRPNDHSFHANKCPNLAPPPPTDLRLRHSRVQLLNEVDVAAAAGGGGPAEPDDNGATSTQAAAAAGESSEPARQGQGAAASSLASRRRREVLAEFRRRAALTLRQRMPVVRDVNKIDRYSRTAFPVLFVVFNVGYWVYYLIRKGTD